MFSNVSSNCLPERMHNHIDCICLTFLHCALSNVSSKCLDLKRQTHICFDFSLLSVIKCFLKELGSKQALNCLPEQMQSHIGCILLTFLHCAFSNVSSKSLDLKRQSHIGCICSNFSTVRFQMCPQIACPNICKVTSVAFFYFSTLCVFKCFLK